MQYMLLITAPMTAEEELAEHGGGYAALYEDLMAEGVFVSGAPLCGADTATTVRLRDGEVLTVDGPFVEVKEQLTGYYTVEAPDLDAAIAWALRIPAAAYGAIEVRPVLQRPMPPGNG